MHPNPVVVMSTKHWGREEWHNVSSPRSASGSCLKSRLLSLRQFFILTWKSFACGSGGQKVSFLGASSDDDGSESDSSFFFLWGKVVCSVRSVSEPWVCLKAILWYVLRFLLGTSFGLGTWFGLGNRLLLLWGAVWSVLVWFLVPELYHHLALPPLFLFPVALFPDIDFLFV